jgi:hypothetical protein
MLRRATVVETDVTGEHIASIISMTRIGELGATLAVTSFLIIFALMMEVILSSETSVIIKATWRNVLEDGVLHIKV